MLNLIKDPNPILKTRAEDWQWNSPEDYDNAKGLEVDMVQLMIENNGIGLAANQVGLLTRVFAIRLSGQVPFCMFNPRVISASETEQVSEEGCLSFPELFLDIKRPQSIQVEYFDRAGNQCIMDLTGIDARCFLHELDHLNGVCFTNKISPLKLALAKKKQMKRKRNGRTK